MGFIKISENDDWIVDYDRERGMYRVSYFEDNHFKDEYWFDAYEKRELGYSVREEIADAVEEKMTYMCGCLNCIKKITQIIRDDVKPFDNQCDNCKIECKVKGS